MSPEKRFAVAPPRRAGQDAPDLDAGGGPGVTLCSTFTVARMRARELDSRQPLAAGEWCVYRWHFGEWQNLTIGDRGQELVIANRIAKRKGVR